MKMSIVGIVALMIGLAGGFLAGSSYQAGRVQAAASSRFGGQFRGGNGTASGRTLGAANGNRPVYGSILSADPTSMTVKLSDGSSKIVILSSSTQINRTSSGTQADLQPGQNVAVIGQTNSDGSVTAQDIQLNPRIPYLSVSPTP